MPTPSPSYREIPLTKGQVALVDTEDYERLSAHSWQAVWNENNKSYYAKRMGTKSDGHRRKLSMSREIMGLQLGDGLFVDHAFHNTLDNRKLIDGKINLRISSRVQNASNRNKNANNTSGYKGVSWNNALQKWHAYIRVNTKLIHLGFCDDKEEAYARYCTAAERHHKEFAKLA
jgi:hypothetical protein